ncbi:MAG: tetratricopeptide repeat protein [Woeseiaceae bacterium]
MTSVWQELKRRNVVRVGIGYAIVAWLLVQIVVSVEGPLNLPGWTDTLVIVLLAIGFIVALILAWAYELTPQGVKRTKLVPLSDSGASLMGRRLDFAIIGLLVMAVGFMFVDNYLYDGAELPSEAPSIAVLPFVDMSPEGDQEYFGDGIAEELLNELVRLDGLRVAGRTSSFTFKGTNANHDAIAAALNVASILEGSIRKDGNRVRITAQLINAADGYHLWSETYDRELENVFTIQEQIATSVAGELGIRLGVGGVNAFHGAGTNNIDAYEAYLQGMASSGDERIRLLEQATQLDPGYSAAWSLLGLATAGQQWSFNPEEASGLKELGYSYVLRAVELDPESAQSTSLLGTVLYAKGEWMRGEAAHRRAIALRSDYSNLSQYGHLLMRAGRSSAALKQYELAEAAEPLVGPEGLRLYIALAQGRFDDARKALAWTSPGRASPRALLILLNERDSGGIAAWVDALPPAEISRRVLFSPVMEVFQSPDAVLSKLREVYSDDSSKWPSKLHDIALLAAYFGDPEFALQAIGEEMRYTTVRAGALWFPIMSDVRRMTGFKQLVADLNLVEYWRASEWADLCRPLGDDDFECI